MRVLDLVFGLLQLHVRENSHPLYQLIKKPYTLDGYVKERKVEDMISLLTIFSRASC